MPLQVAPIERVEELNESDPRTLGRWARLAGEVFPDNVGADWEGSVRLLDRGTHTGGEKSLTRRVREPET